MEWMPDGVATPSLKLVVIAMFMSAADYYLSTGSPKPACSASTLCHPFLRVGALVTCKHTHSTLHSAPPVTSCAASNPCPEDRTRLRVDPLVYILS